MKPRVYVGGPLPDQVVELIASRCDATVQRDGPPLKPPDLAAACREVEGVLIIHSAVNEEVLSQTPKLRVVANHGVGYDHIDVEACTRHGVIVTNTPEVLTETTADLSMALLLTLARRVTEGDRFLREGRWKEWSWNLLWGADIFGKTLGIYGLGRIGKAMARRAKGFSMNVLFYDIALFPDEIMQALGVRFTDPETLLRESDFLSLHVPLTPKTRHLIGASELALMKPTAFLINASRGPVVDQKALIRALQEKRIAGAALDVFEHEPHVPSELIEMPNVVLTPHIGSASGETRLKMAMLAATNMIEALEGRRPPNIVNPEVLAQKSETQSTFKLPH